MTEDEFPEQGRVNRILLSERKGEEEDIQSDLMILTIPSRRKTQINNKIN